MPKQRLSVKRLRAHRIRVITKTTVIVGHRWPCDAGSLGCTETQIPTGTQVKNCLNRNGRRTDHWRVDEDVQGWKITGHYERLANLKGFLFSSTTFAETHK